MKKVEILTARAAADLIEDGDVLTVSSSSGLGCPDSVLQGIGERFRQTQSPRGLTSVHPIAAGDMYGIKGIDHLAQPGLLTRVVAGSYPSGPSSAEPPAIWSMIENEQVEAYNFPSGTLFQMHRAVAAHQPGVLTKVGEGTFIDPRDRGGRMNETTPADIVELHTVGSEEWLFFRSIVPDVAIIRATTADEYGNLTFEDEGSPLGALDLAYAAHNNGGLVIAQVKRVASGRSLDPQKVRVPGILVDAVVLDPDQMQTTGTRYDPAISGQLRRPLADLPPVAYSLEKVMARRAAQELAEGETVNLGFGVSALVPHVLNEEGHGTAVSWVLEQGAVGGVPLLDFAFGCSQNPDAIMQSADQFTLLQGAGFSHTLLSFLEIDARGNVNVHHLPRRRHVTAGVGGFADITAAAPEIVFVGSFTAGRRQIEVGADGLGIVEDGPHTKLVPEVAAVTFNGQLALRRGQRVIYVTERCVMELRPEGITVTEIAPGVDLDRDVLARSAFPLLVSDDLRLMDTVLFRDGAMGLTLPRHPAHERLVRRAGAADGSPR
ncbi:acyl CoA:acetate/3-ketoacid CoA transferase [Occultella gossypii]|uniref:Acyl CoA:acetate/3-ketoacid CoA transferase n=1 Tax=Occultella gossypii TaxID=2800820 RepID=A0ABS7S5K4_9MICO|nr:CoA-transferase [Occultella gossypii]MBZ2195560.1 acyl CoA:acetate/3-ketoacid CoA transferase [Occultella gossypii]